MTKKAFTLIELVVVVLIIGVLASTVAVVVRGNLVTARDARRKNDLKSLQTAMDAYYVKNNNLPPTLEALVPFHLSSIPRSPYINSSAFANLAPTGYYYYGSVSAGGYLVSTIIENNNETSTLSPPTTSPSTNPYCIGSFTNGPSTTITPFVTGVCDHPNFGKVYQIGASAS